MQIEFKHLHQDHADIVNQIIRESLSAVDPYRVVRASIQYNGDDLSICGSDYDLKTLRKVFLVGLGKAVLPMASAVSDTLGGLISGGILIAKTPNSDIKLPDKFKIYYGSHPVPSIESVQGAKALMDFAQQAQDDDLIICLVSGGGSALATVPKAPITLDDIQSTTEHMLASGASIQEVNTLRKHIDQFKGGGLAKAAGKTPMATLILSDVLNDDVSMIASGPTCGDPTTYRDALQVIEKYGLKEKIPSRVYKMILAGCEEKIEDTVKPQSGLLKNKSSHIIANLQRSIAGAKLAANELGFNAEIISSYLVGEAREVGRVAGSIVRTAAMSDSAIERPALFILGGETTVTLKGNGKGGRNQEIAFGAMHQVRGVKNCAVIALSTDGEDGPTDAAGAYVTGESLAAMEDLKLNNQEYGANNDTYTLFDKSGYLIRTGPTGTNVNDLLLLFLFSKTTSVGYW